jgi:hypothetical protein
MPTLAVSSGVRGLQNRLGGNKRIVSVRTTTTPGNLCQLLKTYEVHTMQAAFSAGLLRPHTFGLNRQTSPIVQLFPTPHGYLALQQQQVLAWVFPGVCRTRHQTDHFVDVAYIKPTQSIYGNPNGLMLDTETFDTQVQALAFVRTLAQRGEVK